MQQFQVLQRPLRVIFDARRFIAVRHRPSKSAIGGSHDLTGRLSHETQYRWMIGLVEIIDDGLPIIGHRCTLGAL